MKHLSKTKLTKHHRFTYQPRYYKEDKEAFRFRTASIQRQLDANIAPEEVTSFSEIERKRKKNRSKSKIHKQLILVIAFFGVTFYLEIPVTSSDVGIETIALAVKPLVMFIMFVLFMRVSRS